MAPSFEMRAVAIRLLRVEKLAWILLVDLRNDTNLAAPVPSSSDMSAGLVHHQDIIPRHSQM